MWEGGGGRRRAGVRGNEGLGCGVEWGWGSGVRMMMREEGGEVWGRWAGWGEWTFNAETQLDFIQSGEV